MTACCVFPGAAARTPAAFVEGEGKGQGAWVHDRFLVDLIGAGLATAQTERAVAGGRSMQVSRMRITDADDERSRSFDGPDPQVCLASRPSGEWNDDDYNVRGYGYY